MRRFFVFSLFAALSTASASMPSPAEAAVTVYSYQITGGTSSGQLNIGAITGGGFTVQYTGAPCAACTATLLTVQPLIGTMGMITLTAMAIPLFNPGAGHDIAGYRGANFTRDDLFTQFSVLHYFTRLSFTKAGNNPYISGSVVRGISYVDPNMNVGKITFTGHEVAVPEPSATALLGTAGLMLGAFALRRARSLR